MLFFFRKDWRWHRFTSCLQISHKSAANKWHFGEVVSLTKCSVFFLDYLALLTESAQSFQESLPSKPPLLRKISSRSVWSYSWKNRFRTITIYAEAALKLASAYKVKTWISCRILAASDISRNSIWAPRKVDSHFLRPQQRIQCFVSYFSFPRMSV